MNRQEEIKQQAKLLCNTVSPEEYFIMGAEWADAHPDIDVRTMAAWRGGYKEAIERACEWLDNELPKYIMEGREGRPYISVALIDEFKNAMKYEK